MTTDDFAIDFSGPPGPSYADLARTVQAISGIPIGHDATDAEVLNALTDSMLSVVEAAGYTLITSVATATSTATGDGNVTLSGEQEIGGVQTAASRVLLTAQSDPSENGVYATAAGSWTRAADFDQSIEIVTGAMVPVLFGTNAGSFVLVTPGPITVGTTGLDFRLRDLRTALAMSYDPPGAQASAQNVSAVLRRRPSFRDRFGDDSGITDNLGPFTKMLADFNYPTTFRIERLTQAAEVKFSGFDNTNTMGGYTLDIDRDMTIACAAAQWLSQPGLKVTQPVRFRSTTPDIVFSYGPAANRAPIEKERYLDHGSADWRKTRVIDCSAELSYGQIVYSTGQVIPTAADGAGASYVELATNNATVHFASLPCLPGHEIHAAVTDLATTAPTSFVVILKGGVFVSYQAQGLSSSINWKNTVLGTTDAPVYIGYSAHLSYNAEKSVLGIRVLTPRSFQLLHNGYPVMTVWDTGADILEVGFGSGVSTSAGSVRMSNWVEITGKRLANIPPIRALFIGDSKFDQDVVAHPDLFFREAMETAGGCRIIEINNVAHSGHNTEQQRLVVAGLGNLADYNTAHVEVGTNDIQGNVPLATALTAFNGLLDLLADKRVTVAIPALWYGQAQTPGGTLGENALRYAEGAAIRQAYRAAAAARPNVKVFDYDEEGPILADWLSGFPNLPIAAMVYDNLHPDFVARRLVGYGHAKALLGLMSPEPEKTYPRAPFLAAWFAGTHTKVNDSTAPSYAIDATGSVSLGGRIKLPTSLPAAGTTAVTLPRLLRPAAERSLICACYNSSHVYTGSVPMRIYTDGTIKNEATYPASSESVAIDGLL